MLYLDPSAYAQAEAQDQRCTWVKEKVSSKFELRQGLKLFTNSGYRATLTVATSIALTLALVLPVLKVLTLALDPSCRSCLAMALTFTLAFVKALASP